MYHVLVVDGENGIAAAVRNRYRENDVTVTVVPDSFAAITAIASRRPDIVVSDRRWAESSGDHLVRMLRSHDIRIPVICTSGRDEASDRTAPGLGDPPGATGGRKHAPSADGAPLNWGFDPTAPSFPITALGALVPVA